MTPLYNHPTKILLLDDNVNWLKNLLLGLPKKGFSYALFKDPALALDFVNTEERIGEELKCTRMIDSRVWEAPLIEVKPLDIYKKCYDPKRFDLFSIMIVDYSMPGMNGLEFLKSVKCKSVRKILLTGEASENIAVEAFNKGLINQFFRKQDPDLDIKLREAILEANTEYFLDLSRSTFRLMLSENENVSALTEVMFKEYFDTILEKYKIVEYYSLDAIGSFLLLTDKGEVYTLFTQNEDLALSYYLDVEGLDPEFFTEKEKKRIENRERIFCYKLLDDSKLPDPSLWGPYFFEADKIIGENVFYCALKKGFFGVSADKIEAFVGYQKKQKLLF